MFDLEPTALKAKAAAAELFCSSLGNRDEALREFARSIDKHKREILDQNRVDVKNAGKAGVSPAVSDKLYLNEKRIGEIAESILEIAELPDPVGTVLGGKTEPNGLRVTKISVPFGVIGIICEADPDLTVRACAICIKSGNALILRGGSEAIYTNTIITQVMRESLIKAGLPEDSVQLVNDVSRASAEAMARAKGYIDLLIPIGSTALVNAISEKATVPIISTGENVCRVYIDSTANVPTALDIAENAATASNRAGTLLLDRDISEDILPTLAKRLSRMKKAIEIKGCPLTMMILGTLCGEATDADYMAETEGVLAVKIVDGLYEAVEHIRAYPLCGSECIVTESVTAANMFIGRVDSAQIYINASPALSDCCGTKLGMSNRKLHARGPVGLGELLTYKYVINGSGQLR